MQKNFSYFDGASAVRVGGCDEICKFLDTIEGKLFAKSYDFRNPRVQLGADTAAYLSAIRQHDVA